MLKLSPKNEELIKRDLGFWKRVAADYDESVTNPVTAEEGSINYQEFEKEYIDTVIEAKTASGQIALVEIGCGTGRFLKEYVNNKKVKYLIGIDFSEKMLNCMAKNFGCSLEQLGRRVIIVQGLAEETTIAFSRMPEFDKITIIAICVFNTLGNIESEKRRIQVLERIREMIGENGIAVISVFNKQLMQNDDTNTAEFEKYYHDKRIEKLIIGPNIVKKEEKLIANSPLRTEFKKNLNELELININKLKGEIRTPDFYSHWFGPNELRNLLKIAGLKIIDMKIGIKLGIKQHKAKRGIIVTVRRDQ